MTKTSSESDEPTSAKPSKRQYQVEKPRGGVHPPPVANLRPVKPIAIPTKNDENTYGELTDNSTYSEYAWEFLRRNRYYQQLFDKKQHFDIESWGYKFSSERDSDFGLLHKKHYEQPFYTPPKSTNFVEVQWSAIGEFQKRLKKPREYPLRRSDSMYQEGEKMLVVEYPKDQIAIVFDIAPLLGTSGSAVDIQIELARAYLYEKAKTLNALPRAAKSPSKKLLRAQLRVADLLSDLKELSLAKDGDKENYQHSRQALKTLSQSPLNERKRKISEIMDLIPSYDLKRPVKRTTKPKDENKHSSPQLPLSSDTSHRLGRASALAVGAWNNIYEWDMLRLLQFDDWSPPAKAPRAKKVVSRSVDKKLAVTTNKQKSPFQRSFIDDSQKEARKKKR